MRSRLNRFKNKLLTSNLFKDSAWSLIGNVLGKGLALVGGIVIARLLGKDIYGEYGMIKTTLMNVAIFSTFGLGYTATKCIAESKHNDKGNIRQIVSIVTSTSLIFSIFLCLLVFIFAEQIALYLEADHLSLAIRIFALTIVFNAVTTIQIGILAGFNEFKAIARNNIITGIISFVLTVIFTWLWNIEGALTALCISNAVNCVINSLTVREQTEQYLLNVRPSGKLTKKILALSSPIALQEGLYSISGWINMLLLTKLASYGQVGLYTAAAQWSGVILFIPAILRNVTLSHLSGSNDDPVRHTKVFNVMIGTSVISTLIPCLLVFVFSGFISNFYGDSFSDLKDVLNIFVFTTVFSCIINVYSQEFISQDRNWLMFFIRLMRDGGNIFLAYILIKNSLLGMDGYDRGAYWLALSYLTMSIFTVCILYLVNRKFKY